MVKQFPCKNQLVVRIHLSIYYVSDPCPSRSLIFHPPFVFSLPLLRLIIKREKDWEGI